MGTENLDKRLNLGVWGVAALALCLCAAVGCENKPAATKGPAAKPAADAGASKAPVKSGADAGAAVATTGDACKDYAAAICKEVGGDKSPTCGAFKAAADVMAPEACEAGLKNVAYTTSRVKAMGAKCDELIEKLCKGLGEETQTCGMVRTKTKEFPPERCKMMLDQFDLVLADLKRQEEANKPLSAEQQALCLEGNPPAFGPKDAAVTVVEFSDFECPYCTRAAAVTTQIKEKYKDKVRVVFRQFPLDFHKNAHLAHQAALAAGDQGKFWEYHDMLFANQKALKRENLDQYAADLKLDVAKFKKALDDKTFAKAVDADLELGKKVFVQGTPSMFVNGIRVQNSTDFQAVSQIIEKALAAK